MAQSVGQFFVNVPSVTDREDPDDPRFAIQFKLVNTELNPRTMAPAVCDANRNIGRAYGNTPVPEFSIINFAEMG